MMKQKISISTLLIITGIVLSCATQSSGTTTADVTEEIISPEVLIEEISNKTVSLLATDRETTLAVYYFTQDNKVVAYNDYLVNSLTSAIAGKNPSINVVSRNAIDRLMEEYSFQMTDLVDENNRVEIGRQIGADIVLTGFINPLNEDTLIINIQFIEVETGIVKKGFSLLFSPDESFFTNYSEKVTIQKETMGTGGVAVRTVVLENFEQGYSEYTTEHFEGHWGPGASEKPRGKTGVREGAAYYTYSGTVDYSDKLGVLHETDIEFHTAFYNVKLPEEADGIYLKLKNEVPGRINVMLQQDMGSKGNEKLFTTHLLISDEWQDYYIDFNSFYRDRPNQDIPFNWQKPFTLVFYTSFNENFHHHFYNETDEIKGTLFIDDIGYYKLKGEHKDYILEDFDRAVISAHFTPETYGTKYFTDYSESDSGVFYFNEAVNDFTMELSVEEGGPKDNYLRFTGTPDLAIENINDETFPPEIYITLKALISKDFSNYSTLQFLVRSNMAEQGAIEFYNTNTDVGDGSDYGINDSWSKVTVPLDRMAISEDGEYIYQMMLHFEITKEMLLYNQEIGEYSIIIEVDDFILR